MWLLSSLPTNGGGEEKKRNQPIVITRIQSFPIVYESAAKERMRDDEKMSKRALPLIRFKLD